MAISDAALAALSLDDRPSYYDYRHFQFPMIPFSSSDPPPGTPVLVKYTNGTVLMRYFVYSEGEEGKIRITMDVKSARKIQEEDGVSPISWCSLPLIVRNQFKDFM